MNPWLFFIALSLVFFLSTDTSYAGAALYRVRQVKQQKAQEEYQREHQMYEQHQAAQAQNQQQGTNEPKTYEQAVEERNQALAKAVLNAHNLDINPVQQKDTAFVAGQQGPVAPSVSTQAQETVDLSQVWKKLDKRSMVWTLLIDEKDKLLTVSEYIDRFRKQGVRINAPPLRYVQMIDQMSTGNPEMLERPFGELLQVLAIIDYDFDNGVDKDTLAKVVLGNGYAANKKRFSQ